MLLCTGAFTHRRLYTQKLSHREALKHSIFYTDAIIHRNFYTRCFSTFLLGTVFLTQRSHYTEQLLHADALTVRRLYTEQLLAEGSAHGCLCTQELLHTSFYTHTHKLYIEKLLHRAEKPVHWASFTRLEKQFYFFFWRSELASCEMVAPCPKKTQFTTHVDYSWGFKMLQTFVAFNRYLGPSSHFRADWSVETCF